MRLLFDEFAIAAHVDEFAIAALMVVLVVGGMRLFYGSWPWEARKTWYRTRQAVEYVEALAGKKDATRRLRHYEVSGMQLTRAVIVLIATEWFTTIRCRRLCHHFSYQPLLKSSPHPKNYRSFDGDR